MARASRVFAIFFLLISLACPGVTQMQSQANSQSAQGDEKDKSRGTKDDVGAIGTRALGRTGLGNWYSLEKEIIIGKSYANTYKAGYDPQAFVSFFEKATAREKKKPGTLAEAFATHPPTSKRLIHTQHEIANILPSREQYIITTSEFDEMKARLISIEKRRVITDEYRPTLRRAASSHQGGEPGVSKEEDRPTLKRRDGGAESDSD